MNKTQARQITGGVTRTSKMPCLSYSLPTVACRTGYLMAKVKGSICSSCYADKGFYSMYASTVQPAQHARLTSIECAISDTDYRAQWLDAMQALIGDDKYFRWHDSGDLQSIEHLELYAELARRMPSCKFWLPTREYSIVAAFTAQYDVPENLIIRLSAMFVDKPVCVPASLRGARGITVSNVHKSQDAVGYACSAYSRQGKCGDCRACWSNAPVSYPLH
jgi:hypothetical protein